MFNINVYIKKIPLDKNKHKKFSPKNGIIIYYCFHVQF